MAKKTVSDCSYPESNDDTIEARISVVFDRLKAIRKEEADLQQELKDLFQEQEKEALEELILAQRRCEAISAGQARMKEELGEGDKEDDETFEPEASALDVESVHSKSNPDEIVEPSSQYTPLMSMAILERETLLRWEKSAGNAADEKERKAAQWREIAKVWLIKGDDSGAQWASQEETNELRYAANDRKRQKEHEEKILKLNELIDALKEEEEKCPTG